MSHAFSLSLSVSRPSRRLTTFRSPRVNSEPNRFPYACDAGIFHYTLWSRRDLSHEEILSFVDSWCRDAANIPIP